MRRITFTAVFIICILFTTMAGAAPAHITVAIELDKLAVQLRGQSAYQVLDMRDNRVVYASKDKQNAFLNIKEGELYINNDKLSDNVRIVPMADNFIEINRRTYRGTFNVYKTTGNTINIVNELPIEDYVTSTLSQEIDLGYNIEVIKAQAVAIRAQAYFLAGGSNDIYDTVANNKEKGGLAYLGKDAEGPEAIAAVQATLGEIMLYKGRPVYALWHISSGGYTESGKGFFNIELPYLQTVKDFDEKSRFYRWKQDFIPTDFDALFERAGYKLGKIQTIRLSKLPKDRPISNPPADRSATGRLKEIIVMGEQGQAAVLSAQKFIEIVGLNSNLFDVSIGTPIPKDIIATVKDPMGNDFELDRIQVNIGERDGYRLPGDDDSTRRISRVNDDKIIFSGYGTGHGFGLSQQGAQTMAEKALQGQIENKKKELEEQRRKAKEKPQDKNEGKAAAVNKTTVSKPQVKPDTKGVPAKEDANTKVKAADIGPKAKKEKDKKEEVKLDKNYYRKILTYYFTDIVVEKVY